jgi:hypothetical protein
MAIRIALADVLVHQGLKSWLEREFKSLRKLPAGKRYQHAHRSFPKTILLTQHDELQYVREALEAELPWRTISF